MTLDLVRQPGIIHAGAASRDTGDRQPGQHGHNRRGGRGVADAHIPGGDQVETVCGDLRQHIHAFGDGFFGFGAGHGRAFGQVARAMGNFPAHQAGDGWVKIGGHANIDNGHAGPGLARQHVDGCAAMQEIQHHLRCDFGG